MELNQLSQDTNSNIVHCPFNTSHTMLRKTLVLHLTKCPDKNNLKKDDTAVNQNQCMMKPQLGLTKAERKKFRVQAHQQCANVDLSYNPNLSINDRLSSATSNGGNGGNKADQSDQQTKKDGLFFGKRPNN